TIIESSAHFLSKEDEDIAAALKKILEDDGIKIWTNTKVSGVSQGPGGVEVTCEMTTITGSHLLVATGRSANTAALNLMSSGIQLDDHGFIRTNDKLETNVPGIYALGDVKGGPQFTHISYNDHLIVYKNLIEKGNESIASRPSV